MTGNHLTDIALGICRLGAPFILAYFLITKVFLLGLDLELDQYAPPWPCPLHVSLAQYRLCMPP